jgi:alpha-glucosidase
MWWRQAVIYQVYPRSFVDSDGDGVGDLRGIVSRLDHLEWLGVDAVWLNPVMPSPNADWGYDVSDYCDIHPELGTLADFDELVIEAGRRGIRVLCDLVPNHTSIEHPWFDSHPERYVWADPKPDGSPPNNWVSNFGGSAWSLDERTGHYYLHLFLPSQPDLDWWNPEVPEAFDQILRFWFDRGVAGFRIDVCHAVVKDRDLRDNPPATDEDPFEVRVFGQRHVYSSNRPETHDVIKRWRSVARSYEPERLLLGETYVWDLDALARFYGDDDELHLGFNIPFVSARFEAPDLAGIVEEVERSFPVHAWPVWTGSNHDAGRLTTRWCKNDERKVRCALMMLLTLRGTPVLYYGDEIGLPAVELEREQLLDPVGIRFYPAYGRDPGRTPMQWTPELGAGFTSPGVTPWLPLGDPSECNVTDQKEDPGSVLHLCRDLIALRRGFGELAGGDYSRLPSEDGTWRYRRGASTEVILNLRDEPLELRGDGLVLVGTDRSLDGQSCEGASLGAWAGAVVSLA